MNRPMIAFAALVLALVITSASQTSDGTSAADLEECAPASVRTDLLSQIRSGMEMLHMSLDDRADSGDGAIMSRSEEMLATPSTITGLEIVLDVSEGSKGRIPGTINISYARFIWGGKLRPAPELAQILGDAGITREKSLVIYGKCLPCGGGPAASTYVYWMLKYLGHDNVRVLETGDDVLNREDLPGEMSHGLPEAEYLPVLNPGVIATYAEACNASTQVIDARKPSDYNASHIPGAINLPYEMVLAEDRTRPENDLARLFSEMGISKERPVVVYTDTGIKATVVWFCLVLMGYDAKVYSVQAWNEYMKTGKDGLIPS